MYSKVIFKFRKIQGGYVYGEGFAIVKDGVLYYEDDETPFVNPSMVDFFKITDDEVSAIRVEYILTHML